MPINSIKIMRSFSAFRFDARTVRLKKSGAVKIQHGLGHAAVKLGTATSNAALFSFFPNTEGLGCLNCGHGCRGDHTGIEQYLIPAVFSLCAS